MSNPVQSELEKLANKLVLLSDGGATGISFDLYDLADYILQREQEAFKRGRIAEAKTCEEAKRHQATPQDSTASKEEA
jgi:hypothetical protein